MKILTCGAGGFISGHLTKRLIEEDHEVTAVDVKPLEEWYQVHPQARNVVGDLRDYDVCFDLCRGQDQIYHHAADMGGMGFISTHRIDCMESVLITINLLKAASRRDVKRVFYASSACVYPDFKQKVTSVSLAESDAWPADPEPGYGLEKLYGEQLCKFYTEEFGLQTRVARYHNIFGPEGTYRGGREKAPAAISRKVAEAVITGERVIDIWGDGAQTRSFLYIDECLEGTIRLMDSDHADPLNIGSDELVSINQLVTYVEQIAGVVLHRKYNLTAPQGVRGRNSNNDKVYRILKWKPTESLQTGLQKTYDWVFEQMKRDMEEESTPPGPGNLLFR